MTIEEVFEHLELEFDSDIGIFAHKKTRVPLTVFYDERAGEIVLLDQVKLPYEATVWRSKDWREVATQGIKGMIARGSQTLGCVAGYTMLLAANEYERLPPKEFGDQLWQAAVQVKSTRPTAYPLIFAVELAMDKVTEGLELGLDSHDITDAIKQVADYVLASDLVLNWYLRQEGKKYLEKGDIIITHCNGGSMSSSYGGHALGLIEEAYCGGLELTVIAKETRPRSQGYKLTVWELNRAGVPVIIITDNMVTASIRRYGISKAFLGVDRVSKDGSVANKIGSADLAYILKAHGIPFYYATSYSTIDLNTLEGKNIPIEERSIEEITKPYRLEAEELKRKGMVSAKALDEWPPKKMIVKGKSERGKVTLFNPAFDVTPPELITMIVTDIGSFKPSEISTLTQSEIARRVENNLKEVGLEFPRLAKI